MGEDAPDAGLEPAVAAVRAEVPEAVGVPARAERVRRLDRPGGYVLVRIGEPGAPGWVAAVDPGGGGPAVVLSLAADPSGRATVHPGPGELVWSPALSRSPLYPLRRVVDEAGRERLLDVEGREPPSGPRLRG